MTLGQLRTPDSVDVNFSISSPKYTALRYHHHHHHHQHHHWKIASATKWTWTSCTHAVKSLQKQNVSTCCKYDWKAFSMLSVSLRSQQDYYLPRDQHRQLPCSQYCIVIWVSWAVVNEAVKKPRQNSAPVCAYSTVDVPPSQNKNFDTGDRLYHTVHSWAYTDAGNVFFDIMHKIVHCNTVKWHTIFPFCLQETVLEKKNCHRSRIEVT